MDNSNIRIAKNTLLLYIRMLFTMGVSLYTSRVLLQALGIENFGVYNVVGGIVVLFTFISNAMCNATQRYLNYSIGKADDSFVHKVFCTCMSAHLLIAIIILVLAETVGLWFVVTKLNIPMNRFDAAMWIYQTTIIVSLINLTNAPYNATIIAQEKMSFYAYLSILDVSFKLLIAYLLLVSPIDRLILYGLLLVVVSLINRFIYRYYCRKYYFFCIYEYFKDKSLFSEILFYMSWSLFGGAAMVGAKQGMVILLNIFFDVTLNAALGVANQVKNAIFSFVTSFQTAFNPQLVKLFASHESEKLSNLIYRSSKLSFFLLFIISFPIVLCCEEIFRLWFVEVPNYAVTFTRLVIIGSFFDAISAPLWTTIGATGKIKWYHVIVSVIIFLEVPFVYISLRLDAAPYIALLIDVFICASAYLFRLLYVTKKVAISLKQYFLKMVIPCIMIVLFSIPVPIYIKGHITGISGCIISSVISIFISCISLYYLGLTRIEKKAVSHFLSIKLHLK